MATRRWRLALEMAALTDVKLEAHEVDTGGLLDEAVLSRRPRIRLEEAGRAAAANIDERHRSRRRSSPWAARASPPRRAPI